MSTTIESTAISTHELIRALEKEVERAFPKPTVWAFNTHTGNDAFFVAYDLLQAKRVMAENGFPNATPLAAVDIAIGRAVGISKGAL